MLNLTGKLISGSLALAITAAGSLVLHNNFKSETIGDKLIKEGLKLLSDDSNQWDLLIDKYKTAKEEKQDQVPRKIKDLDATSEKIKLQEKCKNLWNKQLGKEQSDMERVKEDIKNWCTVDALALKSNSQ